MPWRVPTLSDGLQTSKILEVLQMPYGLHWSYSFVLTEIRVIKWIL